MVASWELGMANGDVLVLGREISGVLVAGMVIVAVLGVGEESELFEFQAMENDISFLFVFLCKGMVTLGG